MSPACTASTRLAHSERTIGGVVPTLASSQPAARWSVMLGALDCARRPCPSTQIRCLASRLMEADPSITDGTGMPEAAGKTRVTCEVVR